VLGSASAYFGVVPDILSVQGLLANSTTGGYLTGSYSMNFSIWNASSGGTMFWNETQSVSTNLGYFDVLLGTAGTAPDLGNSVFYAVRNSSDHNVYLQVAIAGETLSPRYQFGQAPYTSTSDWANMSLQDVTQIGKITTVGIDIESAGTSLTATSTTDHTIIASAIAAGKSVLVGTSAGKGIDVTSSQGHGVYGRTLNGSFAGVFGEGGPGIGVQGDSNGVAGVYGTNTGSGFGVYGQSNSGYAIYAETLSGSSAAIYGTSPTNGSGVQGYSAGGFGVYGRSSSNTSAAVYGSNLAGGIGVYGDSASGDAAYFAGNVTVNGNLTVTGTLSKGGGSFLIDHPLDPKNEVLRHSFAESPEMLNIYKGNARTADGKKTIQMPDWFVALNGKDLSDYSFAVTPLKSFCGGYYVDNSEIASKGRFTVVTEKDCEFSWVVYAVRHDAFALKNPVVVEQSKQDAGLGSNCYLSPSAFGAGEEQGCDHQRENRAK